ncbi:MAG: alpha/beta hydrolase fold domain-containing protein [Kiritimatiellae bacterium]|nr:alpha/beta hydrolase fold domain-containing protein [Kiritimatiellia bacterium]
MSTMKPFDPDVAERQPVWPAGRMPDRQPHQIAAMTDEAEAPGFDPAAHAEPFLDWYPPPPAPNGRCAILISGGAYVNCCDVGHVKTWRERFEALGCQCVNFVYRTPWPEGMPLYKTAWEDARRAVRLVRSQAAARGFDPERIATVSMSAGSHLALLLATASQTKVYEPVDALDATPCHVNAVVAFAPAGMLSDGPMRPNDREGDGLDIELDPAFAFDAKTPPVFLSHGGADPYSTFNSTRVYRRLRAAGVPAELHVHPDRPHGMFGLERGVEFLRQIGFFGPPGPEVPVLERFASDADRAGAPERVPLWPAGRMPDAQANQCEPFLEWHLPARKTTDAIQIVWSGGAYGYNDPDGFEVAPARRYLNALGMAVVTVRYRTPRPAPPLAKHVTAWQDAQRAIRLVRAGAAARGLDPGRIGVMGSSAGAHLALLAATGSRHQTYLPVDEADALSRAVQWCVAIYPAYSIEGALEDETRDGSNDPALRLAPEFPFDPDTPPVLFLHGDADPHPATASVAAWEQLRRMGVQGAVHTYATRGHCFYERAAPGTGSHCFLDRIRDFLADKGFIA